MGRFPDETGADSNAVVIAARRGHAGHGTGYRTRERGGTWVAPGQARRPLCLQM